MTVRTWGIGGQAEDDEGSARLVAHFAVSGRIGILGKDDLQILPLTTPGPGFRMRVGAGVNPVPGKPRQKYVIEADAEETVTGLVGPGSSGARHDLVVLRTDNPNLPGGGQYPPDPVRGAYSGLEVITGVPFGTRSFAALAQLYAGQALARIEYPASTNTIGGGGSNAKIVDLRAVNTVDATDTDPVPGTDLVGTPPAAASQTFFEVRQGVSGQGNRDLTSSSFGPFPAGTAPSATFLVPVPSWANSFAFEGVIDNLMTYLGDVSGEVRLHVGDGYSYAQPFRHEWAGQPNTVKIGAAGSYAFGADIRGKLTPFVLEARRLTGSPGYLSFKQLASWLRMWVHFRA